MVTRAAAATSGRPLSNTRSAPRPGSKRTRVRVRRASKVMDSDPTAGRFSALSRLPQYLIRAIFGWATAVAVPGAFMLAPII